MPHIIFSVCVSLLRGSASTRQKGLHSKRSLGCAVVCLALLTFYVGGGRCVNSVRLRATLNSIHRISGVPRIFFFGGSTNSVEDSGQRERGSGGGSPLVRGSGGSCNLVQEI